MECMVDDEQNVERVGEPVFTFSPVLYRVRSRKSIASEMTRET